MMPKAPSTPQGVRKTRSAKPSKKAGLKPGGRLNTGSTNREVYFQVNLHDLDAYTQQVLEAERARRRLCFCRFLFLSLVVGLVSSGFWTFGDAKAHAGLLGAFGHNSSSLQGADNDDKDNDNDNDNDNDYQMTTCERHLNGNMSFHQLFQQVKNDPLDSKRCRPETDACVWQNPTVGKTRGISDGWNREFLYNKEQIDDWVHNKNYSLDVVLVGDSLVEHMEGKELGKEQTSLRRDHDVFDQLFNKSDGGALDGLALGIGGDRCANLLYRLTNGELTKAFNPKVWWIVVGTEDWEFGSTPAAILAGVIAIVNAIRSVHPDTQIVINSLLPHQVDDESIRQVNLMLGCYVYSESLREEPNHDQDRKLHFFNATEIFLKENKHGELVVNSGFMMRMPNGEESNPDAHGEFLWGKRIVESVQKITDNNNSGSRGSNHENRRSR